MQDLFIYLVYVYTTVYSTQHTTQTKYLLLNIMEINLSDITVKITLIVCYEKILYYSVIVSYFMIFVIPFIFN